MRREQSRLQNTQFDVVIIGAGVCGAFLAWDLSQRGIKVALLEKADFGACTSSASSKLLHGGVRYLQQLQLGKVLESAKERARFINFAPNIPRWIPFVIPTYNSGLMKSRWTLQAGMSLYKLICAWPNRQIFDPSQKVPIGKFSCKKQLVDDVPLLAGIEGLTGGQVLFEAHMHSPERMTLELIKRASERGACVMNYVEVESFLDHDGLVRGVNCHDLVSGDQIQVRSKLTVNAAGPYVAQINRMLGGRLSKPTTGYSKGMHLVTRQLEPNYALAMVTKMRGEAKVSRGGRHIFVIPWRGRSLIGTTNVPHQSENLDKVTISEQEIEDFLMEINFALPNAGLKRTDVDYAFAGLYPLIAETIDHNTYQGTGEYQVIDHADSDSIEGFISMMGAKYTTAGRVSAIAMDMVIAKLGKRNVADDIDFDETPADWQEQGSGEWLSRLQERYIGDVPNATIEHLVTNYGISAESILQLVQRQPELAAPLARNRSNILAELYYCLDEEMICHLEDFIFRRTGLGTIGNPGADCLLQCAELMAKRQGWSGEQIQVEIARVESRYCYGG